ncbi:hypothetical protein SFRURICE_007637 [Spodoptera frugiperda]|nr:hypothetical protein SFRURICE_007637 [Spodoptera frugiperda]
MLDNLIVSSGVVYYTDLVESRANFLILSPALNSPREVETIVFFSSPLITSSDLFRCGIQDSHSFPWDAPDFSVPVFSYPGLQELQRYGRLWRACPINKGDKQGSNKPLVAPLGRIMVVKSASN